MAVLLGTVIRFDVLFDLIPAGLTMTYWPGDDVFLVGKEGRDAHPVISERSNKVIEFVRTPSFKTNVMCACVGSIPRWHYVRSIHSRYSPDDENEHKHRRDILKAMRTLVEDTRKVMWRMSPMAEIFFDSDNDGLQRIQAWNSLMTTVVYMGEKYRPYTTPIWKMVHTRDCGDLESVLAERRCCADTGLELQIYKMVQDLEGVEREQIIAELKHIIPVIANALENSVDNDIIERFFSIIRWLGLKHPFRPCRLSTLDRELCNRFYLGMQKDWFNQMVKDTVGTTQNLLKLSKFKKHKYNSWTNFLRCVKKPASEETSYHWSNVPTALKDNWAVGGEDIAGKINSFEHKEREREREREKREREK